MVAIQRAQPGAATPRTGPAASTSAPTSAGPPARASPATSTCTCCPAGTATPNFMTSVAEVRVLPESLRTGYDKLRAAWPGVGSDAVSRRPLNRTTARRPARRRRRTPTRCPRTSTSPTTSGRTVFPDIKRRRSRGRSTSCSRSRASRSGARRHEGCCSGDPARGSRVPLPRGLAAASTRPRRSVASRTVGFPVGHASAQLAWRGLSRPAWRILLYSADEPPSLRGLVELDAVDGTCSASTPSTTPKTGRSTPLVPPAGPGDCACGLLAAQESHARHVVDSSP